MHTLESVTVLQFLHSDVAGTETLRHGAHQQLHPTVPAGARIEPSSKIHGKNNGAVMTPRDRAQCEPLAHYI